MGDATQIHKLSEEKIQSHFARVLERYLTPGGDALRIFLSPVVLAGGLLLVERELEVTGGAVGPSDRYTEETLLEGLDEMGVNANGAVTRAIGEMAKSGFVEVMDNGRLIARPALTAFKDRLDAVFPRMQGLNLVAYLIQTVDEVMSGRKGLDVALDQFGQTLELQTADSSPAGQKRKSVSGKSDPSGPGQKRANAQTLKSVLSRRLRQRETGSAPVGHTRSRDPVVFSAGGRAQPGQVRAVFSPEPKAPSEKENEADQRGEEIERQTTEPFVAAGHEFVSQIPPPQEDDVIPVPVEKGEIAKTAPPPFPEAPRGSPTLNEPVVDSSEGRENRDRDKEAPARAERTSGPEKDPVGIADDSVPGRPLRKIGRQTGSVATTRHLASLHGTGQKPVPPLPDDPLVIACPVCDAGQIREQKTEKARSYFTCSNPDCVFVSWGQPHARVCPSCGNLYLVETTGKGGEPVLTCPRATCRYRHPIAGRDRTNPPGSFEAAATSPSGSPLPSAKRTTRSVKRGVRRRVVRKKR